MASTKQMQERAKQKKMSAKIGKLNSIRNQNDEAIAIALIPYIKQMSEDSREKIAQSNVRYQERFGKRNPLNFKPLSLEETVPYMAMFKLEYENVIMPDFTDKKVHKEFSDHTQSLGIYAGKTLVGFVKFNMLTATRILDNGLSVEYPMAMIDVVHVFKEYRNYGIATKVYQTVMDNSGFGEEFLRSHTCQAVNIQSKRVVDKASYWLSIGLGRVQPHPQHDDMLYLKTGYESTTTSRSITPFLSVKAMVMYKNDPLRSIGFEDMARKLSNSGIGVMLLSAMEDME
jgi:hypothetical protein